MRYASANTRKGIESCGILAGKLNAETNVFVITTLIIPHQVLPSLRTPGPPWYPSRPLVSTAILTLLPLSPPPTLPQPLQPCPLLPYPWEHGHLLALPADASLISWVPSFIALDRRWPPEPLQRQMFFACLTFPPFRRRGRATRSRPLTRKRSSRLRTRAGSSPSDGSTRTQHRRASSPPSTSTRRSAARLNLPDLCFAEAPLPPPSPWPFAGRLSDAARGGSGHCNGADRSVEAVRDLPAYDSRRPEAHSALPEARISHAHGDPHRAADLRVVWPRVPQPAHQARDHRPETQLAFSLASSGVRLAPLPLSPVTSAWSWRSRNNGACN